MENKSNSAKRAQGLRNACIRAFVAGRGIQEGGRGHREERDDRWNDRVGGRSARRWSIDGGLLLCVCYVNRSLVTDPPCRAGQPLC